MQGYTQLRAPFDGVVTERRVDVGAMASPGVPLLTVDRAGALRLEVTVDESLLAGLRQGAALPVRIPALGTEAIEGRVARIVPAADAASHSFLVKIDLPPSKDLRAGMYATAQIPTGTKQAILAPRSAIVLRGSLPCAYVLDVNGVAQLRYMTTGATHGNNVEILSGIAAGEKLVDDPGDRELAGKRIEVQP
jgi:RND family efflux transporter MFP subunit